MKKVIKKLSYTHRITLVILIFSLLPCLLLGSIYLKNASTKWKKDILINYQNDTDTTALIMSKTITEFQAKMQYLINNYELRSYLSRIDNLDIPQALDMIAATNETVSSITVGNNDMTVRWYPHKSTISYGNYCYTLERFAEEFQDGPLDSCYQKILALDTGDYLWKVRKIAREGNNRGTPREMLCLYSQTTGLYDSSCILEFSIPVKNLNNPNNAFSPVSGSILAICLNQSDTPLHIVVGSTLDSYTCEELLNEYHHNKTLNGYETVHSIIPGDADSEVIYIIPQAYVSKLIYPKIATFMGIALIVTLGILSTCYVTSYFLTRKIGNALNTLSMDLNHILISPIVSDLQQEEDEIHRITLQVRKLIQDTQEYCSKLEHYESESLRMELELLQMRFNPHLLYNTLDAINHQIRNPMARSTIESLCSYYRIVLNNGHMIIRIEDEIDMIKQYLSIVKFTYGLNDITYDFEIEEQVKQYTIIKHLLQPIVENALNHGIRPTGQGGTLRILAYQTDNDIYIVIKDDGIGMTEEKAKSLLTTPSASITGGGYGIYNVLQRIQVYYGKEYGLTIHSSPDGTDVTLRIPKMIKEEA